MALVVSFLEMVRDVLAAIPGTFWGVVVGSALSLGGVVITNRNQNTRMIAQFAHDRELKNRDRSLSLKKDIYLEAAKSLNECVLVLSQLPLMDIPDEKVSNSFTTALAVNVKVHMVGDQSTLNLYMDLTGAILTAYMELLEKRLPLRMKHRKSQDTEEVLRRIDKDMHEQLDHMRNYNLNAENNPQRLKNIYDQHAMSNKQKSEILNDRAVFEKSFALERVSFSKDCYDAVMKLTGIMSRLIVLVRDELDTPIDAGSYIEMMQRHNQLSHERTSNFLQRMQDGIAGPTGSQ
jgi:hypothetical protein